MRLRVSHILLAFSVFAAFVIYSFRDPPPEYDVSGFGTCTRTGDDEVRISGYKSTVWEQSPRSVADHVPLSDVNFTSKNGILVQDQHHALITVVTTPDGKTPFTVRVEGDSNIEIEGNCSFTLDPALCKNGWNGQISRCQ